MVKEQHLVFNLIPPEDSTVPDEALAVLSYGEGFVPTPKFNREKFRLQAFDAMNKLKRCENNQAKNLQQNTNEETPEDINSATELCVPPELKIRGVCIPQPNEHSDPLLTEVVNGIAEFSNTLKPRKAAPN